MSWYPDFEFRGDIIVTSKSAELEPNFIRNAMWIGDTSASSLPPPPS